MSLRSSRERLAAATQTEWKAASGRGKVSILGTTDENGRSYQIAVFAAIPTTHRKADVELCAHCPTDLAAALDVIEAALQVRASVTIDERGRWLGTLDAALDAFERLS